MQVDLEAKHQGELMALTKQWIQTTDQLRDELAAVHAKFAKETANSLAVTQKAQAEAAAAAAHSAQERANVELQATRELADATMERLRAEDTHRYQLQEAEDRATALETEVSALTARAEGLQAELNEVQGSYEAQHKQLMEMSRRAEQQQEEQQHVQRQEQQEERRREEQEQQEQRLSALAVRSSSTTASSMDTRLRDGGGSRSQTTHSEASVVGVRSEPLTLHATGQHSPGSTVSYSPALYTPSPVMRELSEGGKRNTQLLQKLKRDRAKREREHERKGAVRGRAALYRSGLSTTLRLVPDADAEPGSSTHA